MHFFLCLSLWNRKSTRLSAGILSLQKPWGLKSDNVKPGHVKYDRLFLLVNGTIFPAWGPLTCIWVALGKGISVMIVFTTLVKVFYFLMMMMPGWYSTEQILLHCFISSSPPSSPKMCLSSGTASKACPEGKYGAARALSSNEHSEF